MKNTVVINIYKHIGETLNSRDAAVLLFDSVKEKLTNTIILDFSDVVFMSRSFADQFYKEQITLKKNYSVTIQIKDASETIRKMFSAVESTQNKRNRFYFELPVFKFSEQNLENYLLGL